MTARSIGNLLTGSAMPKVRRTFQPVRRNSLDVNDRRLATWWQPLADSKRAWRRLMRMRLDAAERFDRNTKGFNRRNGALGHVALQVLKALYETVDYRSGQLDPAIDTICQKVRRARAAVVAALARLKDHGFLDWKRRTEPVDNDGAGPQVKQATNAYRLMRPRCMSKYLDKREASAPPPDDDVQRRQAAAADRADMEAGLTDVEFVQAQAIEDDALRSALADLAAPSGESASSPSGQNPASRD